MLKQCFFFTFLIASECTTRKYHLPTPTNQTGNKKNRNPSITISETGANAVVCIGSNHTIHIDTTGQEPQTSTGINDLDNSTPDNQSTITSDGATITITSTNPNGVVLVGSNNKIYRHRPTQEEEHNKKPIEKIEKIPNEKMAIIENKKGKDDLLEVKKEAESKY